MRKIVVFLIAITFLFSLSISPVEAKHNTTPTPKPTKAPKPPKPNSAGNWTFGSKLAFNSACKAFHQTDAMCTCSLNKVSTQYSTKDFIKKLVNPTIRKRHLVPPAKSIFDSCGGRWDSLFN